MAVQNEENKEVLPEQKKTDFEQLLADTLDITGKKFFSYSDTFADALNGLLYEGREIVLADALQTGPTESFYQGADRVHNQFEDASKYLRNKSRIRLMYLLANQSRPDSKMLLRKAGYVGGAYREQYDNNTLDDVYPVIQIVLNWGSEKWTNERRNMKEIFQREDYTAEWDYIDDMKLHVFDMRHLSKEVRERFHSDLRIVADYLAEGEAALMTNQKVRHKRELVKIICVLSGNVDLEEIEEKLLKAFDRDDGKEEGEKVKDIFTRYWDEGEEKGKAEGKAETTVKHIENMLNNGHLNLEEACEMLGITVGNYEEAKKLLSKPRPF